MSEWAAKSNVNVLLVNYESDVIQLITSAQTKQLHVDSVANGKDAIRCYKREDYDLVLIDISMPFIECYSATNYIRFMDKCNGKRTPIVALAENVDTFLQEQCLSADMDGYLLKPLSNDNICKVLEWHLSMG